LKKPTKSVVKKLKLPVLHSVARNAGVAVASLSKDQLVTRIVAALDSGALSINDFYQTIKDHGEASSTGSAASKNPQTTLIVCPVSVIGNWQEQIETHVAPNTLRVALYHGPNRRDIIDAYDPNNPIDVMLTSYQTLAHDYRPILNSLKKDNSRGDEDYSNPPQNKKIKGMASIFKFPFHRVVLDEAHTIRGSRTGMFHAAKALQAEYRLCLTGTPLQNKPEDIQSLFSFLNVEPFCDRDIFRRSISQPIRDGAADTGLGLLRTLMSHFALRRCKSAVSINLPEKIVELREVHSEGESPHRRIHDVIYDSAKAAIRASMSGEGASRMFLEKNSQSVFEILTRLRQACCSGMLVPPERVERAEQVLDHLKRKAEAGQSLSAEEAVQLLEKLKGALSEGATKSESGEVSLPECAICMDSMNENCAVVLRRCGHVFCNVCLKTVASSTNCFGANANKCPFSRLDFAEADMIPWTAAEQAAVKDESSGENDGSGLALSQQMKQLGPSPKIEALWAGMAEMEDGEKCVIFSQFTKFLDEIGPFLSSHGITFLRIDGSKTQAQRQQALRDFSSDSIDSPSVMLCSLHAAGTGINLTRANHIFMMDTWWNKAVESQAFDRVHRSVAFLL
jgi:SNF2 family DNA or RNA helicase